MRDHRLGHLEVAAQVDVDDLVVFVPGDVEDGGAVDHAGVADQYVDPTEGFGRPGDRVLAGGAVPQVAGIAPVPGADLRRRGRRIGRRKVQDRDPRAVFGEQARRRPADAVRRAAAGDDRCAILLKLHRSASVVTLLRDPRRGFSDSLGRAEPACVAWNRSG